MEADNQNIDTGTISNNFGMQPGVNIGQASSVSAPSINIPTPVMPPETSNNSFQPVDLMAPQTDNIGPAPSINIPTPVMPPETSNNNIQPVDLMAPQTDNIGPAPIINQQVEPMQPEFNSVPVASSMDVPDYDIIETSNTTNTTSLDSMPNEVQMEPTTKFRQVINLIRNCANEIEKMGYYVALDELDLDDNYQVTFKINKE